MREEGLQVGGFDGIVSAVGGCGEGEVDVGRGGGEGGEEGGHAGEGSGGGEFGVLQGGEAGEEVGGGEGQLGPGVKDCCGLGRWLLV